MYIRLYRSALAVVLGAMLATGGAMAAQNRTAIHFADIGNIRNWSADTPDALYIQSMNRQWHRVTFWSPCTQLPFALTIAFVTEANGDLNAYSSILVGGERCWFKTFEASSAPPERPKK